MGRKARKTILTAIITLMLLIASGQTGTVVEATGSATITITATELLDGKAPGDKEFTFVLKDEQQNVIRRANNDEQGKIEFEPISYSQTGLYHYTIEEQKGTDKRYIYDDNSYDLTVEVTDPSGTGSLSAEVFRGKEGTKRETYSTPGGDWLKDGKTYMATGGAGSTPITVMNPGNSSETVYAYCIQNSVHFPGDAGTVKYKAHIPAGDISSYSDAGTVDMDKLAKVMYYFTLNYPSGYSEWDKGELIISSYLTKKNGTLGNSKIYQIYRESQQLTVPDTFTLVLLESTRNGVQNLITGFDTTTKEIKPGYEEVTFMDYTDPSASLNPGKGSLRVTKKVGGNYGDTSGNFRVNVTFRAPDGETVAGDIGYVDNGEEATVTANSLNTGPQTVQIDLKDGETVEFTDIQYGITYSVTEVDYSAEGYETDYEMTDLQMTIDSDEDSVTVIGIRNIDIDTGLESGNGTLSFLLCMFMMTIASIILMMVFLKVKRAEN